MAKVSFKKGFGQVQIKDIENVRKELMDALGISSLQAFRNRMYGDVEPKVSEQKEIERIFKKYKIKQIWD